ncbi:MAG TPA: hypothetical protein VMW61_01085 [Dehalococcoidales bacterium]|nr:hypothetical protein [Dehalococcoidales bacterium]
MENENYQKAVLGELKRISGYLGLLAEDKINERRLELERKYLTTPARKKMWKLMDDSRNNADIAKEAGVSSEAVRLFVNDLEKDYFVEVREEGRSRYPRRLV